MAAPQFASVSVLSGTLEIQQLRALRRSTILVTVFVGLAAFAILAAIFRLEQTLIVQAIAVAVAGTLAALAIRAQFRSYARTVVEYSCTGDSLRLRTLRNAEPVTKAVWDIARVEYWAGPHDPTGYDLTFRDGTEVRLLHDANAGTLIERIKPYCHEIRA